MKLLLDAPEHLWRLIERREYYRATWLFLLSRGVHRALTHDDATEGPSWETKGISIAVHRYPSANLEPSLTVFIGSISSRTKTVGNGCTVQATDIPQGDSITTRAFTIA